MSPRTPTTAAYGLVERLLERQVPIVFSVAGESFLAVLDALYDVRDRLPLITCRHEANAANMAEAVGKLTGKPGICFVTRGPGIAHASVALHTAAQDGTPLIVFVGQIDRRDRGREAFQEIDLVRTFGCLAKWSVEVDSPDDLDGIVVRAFAVAQDGRPGPVVVGLPEDLLEEPCSVRIDVPLEPAAKTLPTELADQIGHRLRGSRRPLLWLGGTPWTTAGALAIREFAVNWNLPVVTGFRRRDLVPNDDANYVGELGFAVGAQLLDALRSADLLLVVGAELGDVETGGYTRLDRREIASKLIHIAARAADLGRIYPAALAQAANPDQAAAGLQRLALPGEREWDDWTMMLRRRYEATLLPVPVAGAVNPSEVFAELRRQLPADAIVSNGAGNYAAWLHRFFEYRQFHTQLAPRSGAMGYGLPAAIAAALLYRDRQVVCVAGDGCFTMAVSDLATAAAHQLNILFIVVNNASYGTIRMHQEARFPGRVYGTALSNPDFVKLATACGIDSVRVSRTAEFAPALLSALAARGPRLIELVTDIRDIAPGKLLKGSVAPD